MNGKIVVLSIVIAAILAIGLVIAINGIPSLKVGTSTQSTSSSTTSSQPSSGGQTGTLAVMITDPPTIPDGVTAVYINYSDVGIHISGAGNQSGWINLQSSGEINLLGVLNSTETIAAVNVTSGLFNSLRFNVTNAIVTFQGTNYTADLVYQRHTLVVPISGGIRISGGQTSGALIEMTPTVLLLGNTTDPTFAFIPAARGYTLPANSVNSHPHVGDRNDYNGNIASQIRNLTHFQISSVTLTPDSLSITVENTGAATVIFRLAALTMTTTVSGGWVPTTPFSSDSKISEFFIIAPNSSLIPISAATGKQMVQTLALAGMAVAPHQSATFTYNGPITIGALSLLQRSTPTQALNTGQRLVLTIFGSGDYARTLVTVGSTTTVTSSSSTTTTVPTTTATSSSSSTTTTATSSSSSTPTTTVTSSSSSTTPATSSSSSSTTTVTSSSSATTTSTTSSSQSGTSQTTSSSSSASSSSTTSSTVTSTSSTTTTQTSTS